MTRYVLPADSGEGPDPVLSFVRWTLAPNLKLREAGPNGRECVLLTRDEIWDRRTGGVTVRPLEVPLGLYFTHTRGGRAPVVEGPNLVELRRAFTAKCRELGVRSQKALLPDIFVKLSKVAQVRQVMGPLHTALATIRMQNELDPRLLATRKREQVKWKTYLAFLEQTGYVRRVGTKFESGKSFEAILSTVSGPQAIPRALGELLYENFTYMTSVLRWGMMVPYLRWTNAYYWRALEARGLPALDWQTMSATYGLLYGPPTHGSPLSQAQSLLEAGILEESGKKCFVGTSDVFAPYRDKAENDPFIRSVLTEPN